MGDLISRQAAIAVADYSDYVGLSVDDVKRVTDEVVKGLRRLPSAQQWIPCSERLPKEKDMVLVTRRSGDVDYVSWSDWWYKQDRYPYLKPIAWMPLPEPYERINRYEKEKT